MRSILQLHKTCCHAKELNEETLEHVEHLWRPSFKACFERVHHSPFAVPEKLKCHIVREHLAEYFAITGETMSMSYDGHYEAMHGHVRRKEELHGLKHGEDAGQASGGKLLTLHKIVNNSNKKFVD